MRPDRPFAVEHRSTMVSPIGEKGAPQPKPYAICRTCYTLWPCNAEQLRARNEKLERLASTTQEAIGHATVMRTLHEMRPWPEGESDALYKLLAAQTTIWRAAEQRLRAVAAELDGTAPQGAS